MPYDETEIGEGAVFVMVTRLLSAAREESRTERGCGLTADGATVDDLGRREEGAEGR